MNLRPYNGTLDRFQLLANLKSFLDKKIINFTEIIKVIRKIISKLFLCLFYC